MKLAVFSSGIYLYLDWKVFLKIVNAVLSHFFTKLVFIYNLDINIQNVVIKKKKKKKYILNVVTWFFFPSK